MLKEFITALGGPDVVAAEVSRMAGRTLTARAVYQWPYDERVPDRWQPYVARMASAKQVAVPAELESVAKIIDAPDADAHKRAVRQ